MGIKKQRMNGDKCSFSKNWKEREETQNVYWSKTKPINQIQLAFQNHWKVFKDLLAKKSFNKGKRVLEVGCGRGSMSAFFSSKGYKCTLLDQSSEVINTAKKIYKKNKLSASFHIGDANALPFEDNSFDVVFSIGLLEHFKNIEKPINEQIRILDKGGLFIGYVVPKYKNSIQKDYIWINNILKGYHSNLKSSSLKKEDVFRSDLDSKNYIKYLKKNNLKGIRASGIYSLPMISHSVDFPFSLMPKESEELLVEYFSKILKTRKSKSNKNPWLCKEGYGQAFIVWGYK